MILVLINQPTGRPTPDIDLSQSTNQTTQQKSSSELTPFPVTPTTPVPDVMLPGKFVGSVYDPKLNRAVYTSIGDQGEEYILTITGGKEGVSVTLKTIFDRELSETEARKLFEDYAKKKGWVLEDVVLDPDSGQWRAVFSAPPSAINPTQIKSELETWASQKGYNIENLDVSEGTFTYSKPISREEALQMAIESAKKQGINYSDVDVEYKDGNYVVKFYGTQELPSKLQVDETQAYSAITEYVQKKLPYWRVSKVEDAGDKYIAEVVSPGGNIATVTYPKYVSVDLDAVKENLEKQGIHDYRITQKGDKYIITLPVASGKLPSFVVGSGTIPGVSFEATLPSKQRVVTKEGYEYEPSFPEVDEAIKEAESLEVGSLDVFEGYDKYYEGLHTLSDLLEEPTQPPQVHHRVKGAGIEQTPEVQISSRAEARALTSTPEVEVSEEEERPFNMKRFLKEHFDVGDLVTEGGLDAFMTRNFIGEVKERYEDEKDKPGLDSEDVKTFLKSTGVHAVEFVGNLPLQFYEFGESLANLPPQKDPYGMYNLPQLIKLKEEREKKKRMELLTDPIAILTGGKLTYETATDDELEVLQKETPPKVWEVVHRIASMYKEDPDFDKKLTTLAKQIEKFNQEYERLQKLKDEDPESYNQLAENYNKRLTEWREQNEKYLNFAEELASSAPVILKWQKALSETVPEWTVGEIAGDILMSYLLSVGAIKALDKFATPKANVRVKITPEVVEGSPAVRVTRIVETSTKGSGSRLGTTMTTEVFKLGDDLTYEQLAKLAKSNPSLFKRVVKALTGASDDVADDLLKEVVNVDDDVAKAVIQNALDDFTYQKTLITGPEGMGMRFRVYQTGTQDLLVNKQYSKTPLDVSPREFNQLLDMARKDLAQIQGVQKLDQYGYFISSTDDLAKLPFSNKLNPGEKALINAYLNKYGELKVVPVGPNYLIMPKDASASLALVADTAGNQVPVAMLQAPENAPWFSAIGVDSVSGQKYLLLFDDAGNLLSRTPLTNMGKPSTEILKQADDLAKILKSTTSSVAERRIFIDPTKWEKVVSSGNVKTYVYDPIQQLNTVQDLVESSQIQKVFYQPDLGGFWVRAVDPITNTPRWVFVSTLGGLPPLLEEVPPSKFTLPSPPEVSLIPPSISSSHRPTFTQISSHTTTFTPTIHLLEPEIPIEEEGVGELGDTSFNVFTPVIRPTPMKSNIEKPIITPGMDEGMIESVGETSIQSPATAQLQAQMEAEETQVTPSSTPSPPELDVPVPPVIPATPPIPKDFEGDESQIPEEWEEWFGYAYPYGYEFLEGSEMDNEILKDMEEEERLQSSEEDQVADLANTIMEEALDDSADVLEGGEGLEEESEEPTTEPELSTQVTPVVGEEPQPSRPPSEQKPPTLAQRIYNKLFEEGKEGGEDISIDSLLGALLGGWDSEEEEGTEASMDSISVDSLFESIFGEEEEVGSVGGTGDFVDALLGEEESYSSGSESLDDMFDMLLGEPSPRSMSVPVPVSPQPSPKKTSRPKLVPKLRASRKRRKSKKVLTKRVTEADWLGVIDEFVGEVSDEIDKTFSHLL